MLLVPPFFFFPKEVRRFAEMSWESVKYITANDASREIGSVLYVALDLLQNMELKTVPLCILFWAGTGEGAHGGSVMTGSILQQCWKKHDSSISSPLFQCAAE